MPKDKVNSKETEQFLNKLAVYGTSLESESNQQQLSELEHLIVNSAFEFH